MGFLVGEGIAELVDAKPGIGVDVKDVRVGVAIAVRIGAAVSVHRQISAGGIAPLGGAGIDEDALGVGAVVVLGPIVRIPIVVRVVCSSDSHREAVGVGGVLGLVIAVAVAVRVLPLRAVEGPHVGAVDRGVPFENRALVRRVTGTVAVGVKATVAVTERCTEIPRAVITVQGVRVVITVAITVVVSVLRSKVGEEITRSGVRIKDGNRTAVHAVVIAKPVAVGVKCLLPISFEHITVKVRGVVVRPTVLVQVFTAKAVNPRRSTLIVTAINVVPVAVGVEIIAALEDERRDAVIGRASVGQRSQRVVAEVVAVAVHPLVANGWHAIDLVKDEVAVCIAVKAEHDGIVVYFIPVRHVHRSVGIRLGMDAMVGNDITKRDRHPRVGRIVGAVEFNAVEDEMVGGWVAGHQDQMVAGVKDIPCAVNRCSGSFCQRDPCARLIQPENGGNGVGSHSENRRGSALKVQAIFVGRPAGLGDGVLNPSVRTGPLLKDTQRAIGGQGSHQQRTVVEEGQAQFACEFTVVGDGVLGEG